MAPKKKLNIMNKKDETIVKIPGDVDGMNFTIMDCENCDIYICDHMSQIFVDDSINCRVHLGPVVDAVFMRDCSDCTLNSSSGQLRISDSKSIKANVFSQSEPALENCSDITFGPYNFLYNGLKDHFLKSKLDQNQDKWSQVFDFSQRDVENWKIIKPEEWNRPNVPQIQEIQELTGEGENPVLYHTSFGGNLDKLLIGSQDQAQGDMMAFDIKTSKQQAMAAVEAFANNEDENENEDETKRDYDEFEFEQGEEATGNYDDLFIQGSAMPIQQIPQQMSQEISKLDKIEQEINQLQEEKSNTEFKLKTESRIKAGDFLKQFKEYYYIQREQLIKKKQKIEENKVKENNMLASNKSDIQGWQKVLENVDLKQNEKSCNKERLKECILNKIEDLKKNV